MVLYFSVMRFILTFIFIYASVSSEEYDVSFNKHLRKLSEIRHPMYNDGRDWLNARYYVQKMMNIKGLVDIVEHKFTTAVGNYAGSMQQVEGINIIGIVEGSKKSGQVIIIGADYDTPLEANPIKNNAGGVAILLETINHLDSHLRRSLLNVENTIIFVAFDLNTKEYSTSGTGHPGSYHFVNFWLPEYLRKHRATLAGALILDSVTTVNYEVDSQFLVPGFDTAFPDAYQKIVKRGNKGNFLGIVSTKNQTSNLVRQEFIDNYHMDRILRPYYLQEMDLHLTVEAATSDVLSLIDHQAHYHFWTYDKQSFPAFLLFDTDRSRDEPNEQCDLECDADTFLDGPRNRFMTNTVYTLLSVLENLQLTNKDNGNSSEEKAPSVFAGLLILIIAYKIK